MSASRTKEHKPVYLITGEDPSLVANEVRVVLDELLGGRDPALVVEEVGGGGGEELDVGAVIDSYTTPPFLIDLRVVVVRDIGRMKAEDAKRIVAALVPPPPGAVLVLVAGHGAAPRGLAKSIAEHGTVLDVTARRAGERKSYLAEHLRGAPVRLTAEAQRLLSAHLGEDLGRLHGLLETLAAAYGEGVSVDGAMLAPFLGTKGSVPIFDLTDAIDRGELANALGVVDRMMGPGGSSGHEILASLDFHFSRAARLDGADLRSGDEAAALLGVAPFPAKKALDLSRQLGSEALKSALGLIADADLDLRGMTGLSERMVVEILVARLARLCGAQRR
jgi:DNA polymerase-3 subunit delta